MELNRSEPQLAAPGAGLPMIELFVARLMVRWKAPRTSRTEAERVFITEREAILELVKGAGEGSLQTPVLIKRLRGLEDSSRYWSVLMTLDHLRIVNAQIASVISDLTHGKIPETVASTARVKPSKNVNESVIAAFEQTCLQLENIVASQANLKTSATFAHPWFGPLDAAGWHFMSGFHMRLHRQQIQCILSELVCGG